METYFRKSGVEQGGKPSLVPNETIIYLVENVTIYQGDNKTSYTNGHLYLTQFRTIWVSPQISLSLAHDNILNVEMFNKSILAINSSPKITIVLANVTFRYSFHSGKRDDFFHKYKDAIIQRKQFLNQAHPPAYVPPGAIIPQHTAQPPPYPGTTSSTTTTSSSESKVDASRAGIGGLMNQMNQKTQETDKILSEAFTDLKALMDKAKDMVTLSEKLKITLEKKSKNTTTGTDGDTAEENEFRSFLLQMGIESPVTKKTAGSKYHNELSKQLSDWIITKEVLTRHSRSENSGMILLSDLYCIFNRARGIELISPDDLYRACLLFENLNLPLRIRKFDSGVIVIQSIDESDEHIAKEILELIKEHGPISPFDLSKFQQISLSLSNEKLLASEKTGKLCRDETVEGIRFFENIFV